MRVGAATNRRGFITLLEMVLVLAIILFVAYAALNTYFKKPALNKSTEEFLNQQDIDTSSSKAILDTTKKKINDINEQVLKNAQQLERLQ